MEMSYDLIYKKKRKEKKRKEYLLEFG